MNKSGGHHRNQVVKFNITCIKMLTSCTPWYAPMRRKYHFCGVLPQNIYLNLIIIVSCPNLWDGREPWVQVPSGQLSMKSLEPGREILTRENMENREGKSKFIQVEFVFSILRSPLNSPFPPPRPYIFICTAVNRRRDTHLHGDDTHRGEHHTDTYSHTLAPNLERNTGTHKHP